MLIAVDRYNALYIDSEYGQTINEKKRRLIPAAELRLATAMRVLEREPMSNGIHLAVPARHDRISQRVPVRCRVLDCLLQAAYFRLSPTASRLRLPLAVLKIYCTVPLCMSKLAWIGSCQALLSLSLSDTWNHGMHVMEYLLCRCHSLRAARWWNCRDSCHRSGKTSWIGMMLRYVQTHAVSFTPLNLMVFPEEPLQHITFMHCVQCCENPSRQVAAQSASVRFGHLYAGCSQPGQH